jgi:mannose-6-phosphate isomerase-like protein (cupin superfamily)
MNKAWLFCLLLIPFQGVTPQEPAPEGFKLWTPASLNSVNQTLRHDAPSDPHHFAVQMLSDFPNDAFILVHREADGQVEWHETQVDVIFVQSGSATLIVGGTMVNAETVAPHEKRNGSIQGGSRQKISTGDILRIPAKTPHQLLLDGSHELNYFVIKVKGY